MGDKTKIEWTDASWNPIRGCSRVSEGCRNCYAEAVAYRFSGAGQPYSGLAVLKNDHASWTGKVEFVEKHLLDPLRWKNPRRIFVNSMSDLFHENVQREWLKKIVTVMALAYWHTFQILTKRAENLSGFEEIVREVLHELQDLERNGGIAHRMVFKALDMRRRDKVDWEFPLPNVWLGVSDEGNQHGRLDILRDTPAAVRFVSIEPLIFDPGKVNLDGIHWVIVGGESGPNARPCELRWIDSIVKQCVASKTPVFVKQLGGNIPDDDQSYIQRVTGKSVHNSKGGDINEFPPELRIREFPH